MDARRDLMILGVTAMLAAPTSAWAATGAAMAPIPNPAPRAAAASGPSAILGANTGSRTPSRSDRFQGGLQVFDYAPGRVYEIWTAPLRVTTLNLAPGESVMALAAGDTLRWQIAETASGDGEARRAHVLVKPLARGLETNLVLTTTARLYLIALRSAGPATANAAVAWSPPSRPEAPVAPTPAAPAPAATPERLDTAYRIRPRGGRPAWTPDAVMSDGVRTFILLPPRSTSLGAPTLFLLSADGEAAMVNYRQAGDVFVVDRVIERAELRASDPRAGRVRIERRSEAVR